MEGTIKIKNMGLPISIDQQGIDWVNRIMDKMTLDEKIGQLIHVASWSNKSQDHLNSLSKTIEKYKIGGLIFFQGNPQNQANFTNHFQSVSDTPLMISIDAEWGLGMRLDEVESFPYQMTLGALQDDDLIYEMGRAVAKQLKRVGVNLNHAPVIDVNTNPKNPVIGFRSFGQDKNQVAQKGKAYMRGLQAEYIMACAKHFPGHGDTSLDSHFDLPVLDKSKEELIDVEFFPFRELVNEGLGAVMTAHLHVPKIDNKPNRASTLSEVIIEDILKNEIGFQGLVITDALDMAAVADYYENGRLEVEALKAGNDILLFVKNVGLAVSEIKAAVLKGEISEQSINEKCIKQLVYKYWMGLMNFTPIDTEKIVLDVNKEISAINEKLYAQSMTLLKKESPFPEKNSKTLTVSIFGKGDTPEEGSLNHHTTLKSVFGDGNTPIFQKCMKPYLKNATHVSIHDDQWETVEKSIFNDLGTFDHIILSIHNVKLKAKGEFGFSAKLIACIENIISKDNAHLVFFGNAYALDIIPNLNMSNSILLAYQENKYTHHFASKILKNEMTPNGKLPVSINTDFTVGTGIYE